MPNPNTATATAGARAAGAHARSRPSSCSAGPFAPGAIGFRAMTKVTLNGEPYAGAQVAAFLNAQSVVQRLNAVVPGRWRQEFAPVAAELAPANTKQALPRLPADRHAARSSDGGATSTPSTRTSARWTPARSPA